MQVRLPVKYFHFLKLFNWLSVINGRLLLCTPVLEVIFRK